MAYSEGVFHLIAILCTLCVEGTGMALWAYVAYPHRGYAIGCSLVVNLVVHTLFWYTQSIFSAHWPWGLYGGELLVILIEGTAYHYLLSLRGLTPWLLSFSLNLASFLAGLWIWRILL